MMKWVRQKIEINVFSPITFLMKNFSAKEHTVCSLSGYSMLKTKQTHNKNQKPKHPYTGICNLMQVTQFTLTIL